MPAPKEKLSVHDNSRCETCKRKFGSRQDAIKHMKTFDHWAPRLEYSVDDEKSLAKRFANLYMADVSEDLPNSTVPQRYEPVTVTPQLQDSTPRQQPLGNTGHREPQFKCKGCKKKFLSQASANQHMEDTKHQEPRFNCETCDGTFTSQSSANKHMDAKDHRKRYQCPTCGKGFKSESALNMVSCYSHPSASLRLVQIQTCY